MASEEIGGTIQTFIDAHFGKLRAQLIGNKVWFVGKDIAKALGYKNHRDALAKHVDDEDKRESRIATPSGEQKMTLINESGMYSLILSSKLPSAKEFKHWVTNDVLPSIRATGGYVDPNHVGIREVNIIVRKNETYAIKRLIKYGIKQGYEANKYRLYEWFSTHVNKLCKIPTGERDNVESANLITCLACENEIAACIDYGISRGYDFQAIIYTCLRRTNDITDKLKKRLRLSRSGVLKLNLGVYDDKILLTNKKDKLVLSVKRIKTV